MFGKDATTVFVLMKNDGLHIKDGDDAIEQLARRNQKSPENILAYFVK